MPCDVTVVSRLSDGDKLREFWSAANPEPNAEFEHFHLICRLRPNILRPYVLYVKGGSSGRAPFILVGRLEEQVIRGKVGYLSFGALKSRVWVGVHGGWLGLPDLTQTEAALQHVIDLLTSGVADMAAFHGVREDSPLCQIMLRAEPIPVRMYTTPWTPHYRLHLEPDPEFLWNRLRSKHRSWLRARERRLHDRHAGRLRWEWHKEFPDLPSLMQRLEVVAARTYQRTLGAGFRDDEEHQERFRLFARQGILRIQTLGCDDRLVAFWIGLLSGGTFYSSETGYDPEWADYAPGNLLFFKLVENLVQEGASLLDFGLGDADYKRRFAEDHYLERDLYLFSRSARGLAAAVLVGGLGRLEGRLKQLVARFGGLNLVKTSWRRRLRS